MTRAAALTLLSALAVVAALLLAAPVGAQDDAKPTRAELRAQVRPVGDAALELRRALKPLRRAALVSAIDGFVGCLERAKIEDRVLDDAPEEIATVMGLSFFVTTARPYAAPVARFVERAETVATDDRIVANGVAAWARFSAALTRFAALRPVSCAQLVAWIRSGFAKAKEPPAPAVRPDDFSSILQSDPAMTRSVLRLMQLGVKSRAARGMLFPDLFGLGPLLDLTEDPAAEFGERLLRRRT